ncbi:MAG: multiheme c-type cytochrome [Desulfomonilaceae bacterium]|nr:multiheme c-type cytochrome [Desulfomonilaceae bacterium]
MKSRAINVGCALLLCVMIAPIGSLAADKGVAVSDATQECLDCHVSVTPDLVEDWKKSRHAATTVRDGLSKPKLARRVSAESVPDELSGVAVGCAECHTINTDAHKDAFDHNDRMVHVTVTPNDCAVCHPTEEKQYRENIMSHARQNLVGNNLYGQLVKSINGVQSFRDLKTTITPPDDQTNADSCYHCHGTAVEVSGTRTRDTDWGEMEFPVLTGWPNQGVGRFNPDGSKGVCTACHSRHQFSIKMARQPYTCSQCHKGPDVPAYQTYEVSKHGNLFASLKSEWNFNEVPWTVGKDFTGPTCAACHVSLVVTPEGDVVAERTHQMNDRLPWRILGLIYSHPHPKSPDTSIIKNKDGLPLPTTLTGEWAKEYLIGPDEQAARRKKLQAVCLSCHGQSWVDGHWARFENTMKVADKMTMTATEIMKKAWEEGVADNSELFDEAMEKQWVEQWLFYANSTRFASAMMGADYGVFANGRWYMAKNIQDMLDRLKILLAIRGQGK